MSEEHDKQSRTEEATDQRLTNAREDGNVPMSREAPNFAYLLAALLVIAVLGQAFVSHLSGFLISLLANVGSIHLEIPITCELQSRTRNDRRENDDAREQKMKPGGVCESGFFHGR